MPDTAVKEGQEWIKSALVNSGLGHPNKCVTVNLAPASKLTGVGRQLDCVGSASRMLDKPRSLAESA